MPDLEEAKRKPHDARAVANLLLARARRRGLEISNLQLQKLLYFAHGAFLTRHRAPLVSGYFEAWKLGPVHPEVYASFKSAGSDPIMFEAVRRDPRTGVVSPLASIDDFLVEDAIDNILRTLGDMPAARLVAMSHARNGPWDFVVNELATSRSMGTRISDKVTSDRFQYLKVAIPADLDQSEALEDAPFA